MDTIFFDMDGVIIDSELHWKKIQSDFLKKIIPTWTSEKQKELIGLSAHDVYMLLVSKFSLKLSKEEYFEYYKDISHEIYAVNSSLIPGVLDTIKFYQTKKLAIVSSAPHDWINIVVKRFELEKYFIEIISADDVAGVGKPNPAIYELAVSKLNAVKLKTVTIEDSEKGVISAKAAGITAIGFRNGFNEHQDLSKADYLISSFKELKAIVLN